MVEPIAALKARSPNLARRSTPFGVVATSANTSARQRTASRAVDNRKTTCKWVPTGGATSLRTPAPSSASTFMRSRKILPSRKKATGVVVATPMSGFATVALAGAPVLRFASGMRSDVYSDCQEIMSDAGFSGVSRITVQLAESLAFLPLTMTMLAIAGF